jgi:hypothetical protein
VWDFGLCHLGQFERSGFMRADSKHLFLNICHIDESTTMTRWSCPAPDCSKDWDSCQRVVSHLHATSCKTILSDPVAIAPFLAAASRWLCVSCSKTWHSRTPVCRDCGLAAPSPSVALPLPDISPPPVPSPRLPSLSTVLCTGVPTFVYMPKSTRSEVATAWAVVAQAVAGDSASVDDLTRFLAFPKAIFSHVPASASRAAFRRPLSSGNASGVGPRETYLLCLRKLFVEPRDECSMEPPSQWIRHASAGLVVWPDKEPFERPLKLYPAPLRPLVGLPQWLVSWRSILLPCLGPSLTGQFFHRQRSSQPQRSNPHCLVSSAGPPWGLLASAILTWPTCSMHLRPRLRPWHLMPLPTL